MLISAGAVNSHSITIFVSGPSRCSNRSIADLVIETHPAVGSEILARQMQEDRAAAAGYSGLGVVIDLDDEIIEVIVAPEPVAAAIRRQPHRLVVMAIAGVFAPGVLGPDGANRQERARPGVAVGPPPQLPRPERAPGGAAIALALVGQNAAAPQRDR